MLMGKTVFMTAKSTLHVYPCEVCFLLVKKPFLASMSLCDVASISIYDGFSAFTCSVLTVMVLLSLTVA